MYVFHYNPETLGYVGNSPVDFCQLEPGTVLVPAWASKNPPPSGWDSRTHLPYYVPAKDAWQVRPLPPPEPQPESVEPLAPEVATELLQDSLQAHLDAAAALMVRLKEGAA